MDKREYDDIYALKNDPQFYEIDNIHICFSSDTQKMAISEKNGEICLDIYREFYKEHKLEIDDLLVELVRRYKKEDISFETGILVNDRLVEELCNNGIIKEISLARYGLFEKYSLSRKHYESFKKAYKERIYTRYVDEELEEVYDPMIAHNFEKFIYSYYKYEDYQKDSISFYNPIPQDKLYTLKYLGENTKLIITSNCNVKEIIETLRKYNKNNNIQIDITDDKKSLNKDLRDLGYFDTEPEEIYGNIKINYRALQNSNLSINQYIGYEKLLYSMIEPAKDMSPFEKYIYAYDITKQFKKYNTPKKDNKNIENLSQDEYMKIKFLSRDLYQILDNDYIVCVGFSNLLIDLLNKLGIDNIALPVYVDTSLSKAVKQLNIPKEEWKNMTPEEKHRLIIRQQSYIPKDDFGGHRRLLVNIKDEKYGIDGIYVSDPTWDNNLEKNIYAHAVMTESDVATSASTNKIDDKYILFSATSVEEFYAMLNTILDMKYRKRHEPDDLLDDIFDTDIDEEKEAKQAISDFHYIFNSFLGEFSGLFPEEYKKITEKYSILKEPYFGIKDIHKINEELQDVLYEVASIVSSKNNNKIDNDTLKRAISVVYKDVYEGGLKEEEIDKMIEDTEEKRIVEFGPSKRTI